ncbi:MAG: PRD domain-containing protein [Anaerorhabdus sp.]
MKVKKVLNNNVVIAEDDEYCESVVIGLGIAFKLKIGEEIPADKIERVFSSTQNEEKKQLQQLVETIPQTYFDIAIEIIEYAQKNLNKKLSNSIYITLTDHINYIKERVGLGILPKNSLKWEIRQYYPKEYQVSIKIVELLEDEFECKLNDDEVASIALHIINAEIDDVSIRDSMEAIQLIDQIMQIIRYQGNIINDMEDLNYQRLITHIRFFVQRILSKKYSLDTNPLYEMVKNSYPQSYAITERIRSFIEDSLNYSVSDDEVTYLVIHIERILNRK